MPGKSFTAVSENLLKIVREAHSAKMVIPVGFQRSFVWARDNIEEFLSSILYGYFVGTFLMLDTPTKDPMFRFQPVEGLKTVNERASSKNHTTLRLVLDGQQRITSLFYALYEPNIPLRGSKHSYRFYLHLEEAVNGVLDDAVVGVSTRDRNRMTELEQLVHTHKVLPFSSLLDFDSFHDWLYEQQNVWKGEQRKVILELQQRLTNFEVPVVDLSEETNWHNIVNNFDRINRTGVKLSLFHLVGARVYLKGVHLRELWEAFEKAHKDVSAAIKPEFLLRVIALLNGKEPLRRTLLIAMNELEFDTFNSLWTEATKTIVQAHKRITNKYGAFDKKRIPYTTLVIPLACLLHKLREVSAGEEDYRKVDCWYWVSVFSQRYDQGVDTKSYQDVRDIGNWIHGGKAPEWLKRLSMQNLNLDIDEPQSAVYLGIMGLVASKGAKDFLTGQPAKLHECEDDHIFPESVYREIYGDQVDSILNRTLIWKPTNKRKGKKQPDKFFNECLVKHGNDEARLIDTLSSHFISKDAYVALKDNDFEKFITERRKALDSAIKHLFLQTIESDVEITREVSSPAVVESELPTDVENQQDTNSLKISLPTVPGQLNRDELANRLNVHHDTVIRKRYHKNFTEWSQKHDPDGIGWTYVEEAKIFYRQAG